MVHFSKPSFQNLTGQFALGSPAVKKSFFLWLLQQLLSLPWPTKKKIKESLWSRWSTNYPVRTYRKVHSIRKSGNGGSTSVITYLRRGKILLPNSSWQRGVKICENNNLCRHQGLWRKGGWRSFRCQRLPCRLWWRPCWGSCAPAAHRAPWWSKWIRLKEAVIPWRICARAGSWQNRRFHGWCMLEQSIPGRLHHVEKTHAGAVCEKL